MNTPTDIHQLIRTETAPGSPTIYLAFCKYESTNIKEFRKIDQNLDAITCQACMEKLTKPVYRCNGGRQ